MIRKIGFVIVCLVASGLCAQNGTVSPYSYFGLGDARADNTVEYKMMGGIGMYGDSIHVNLRNPAAYSRLGVQSPGTFGITTYTVGLHYKQTRLKSFTEEQNSAVTNIDYLSLAFSLKKGLGLGFGLEANTSVGYNIVDQQGEEGSSIVNEYSGTGGINRVYLSLGYEFAKNLSLGVTANYNFGTLESLRVQSVENVQFGVKDERSSRIEGIDLNYALNYTPKIDERHTLFTSVRISTQANLSATNKKRIGSFSLITEQDVEAIDVDLAAQGLDKTGVKIPTTTTFGVGYGQNMKWFLGAEYSFQKLSDYSNEFLEVENVVYKNANIFALGGFYTPDRNSFNNYFKRVTYRAGVRVDNTGLVVNDVDINNFGITFGVGLPLGNNLSNLNVGFELGRRGTTSADLIEESYFKVNVGLSLNDIWFAKRKIR